MAEADAEDDGKQLGLELVDVDAEQLSEFAGLEPIKEDRARVGLHIHEAAGLANGFGEIDPPSVEVDLALLAGGSEGQELLLLAVDVDTVAGLHVDVIRRLVDEIGKRYRRTATATIQ